LHELTLYIYIYRLDRWQRGARGLGRRTLKAITYHAQPYIEADNETYMQTYPKNHSLVHATVPWCRYHLGHVSLFHVFWHKVGGTSPRPIAYSSYNLYGLAEVAPYEQHFF